MSLLLIFSGTLSKPPARATTLKADRPAVAFYIAPLPDLIIEPAKAGSTALIASNGTTHITAVFLVANRGEAISGKCKARLYLAYEGGGEPYPRVVDLDVAALLPGEETTIKYSYSYPTKGPAIYIYRAIVDIEMQVKEMNKKNNRWTAKP